MSEPRCVECGRPILPGEAYDDYDDGLVCGECNAAYDLSEEGPPADEWVDDGMTPQQVADEDFRRRHPNDWIDF